MKGERIINTAKVALYQLYYIRYYNYRVIKGDDLMPGREGQDWQM